MTAPRAKNVRPTENAIQDWGCGLRLPETGPLAALSAAFKAAQYAFWTVRVSERSASSIARAAWATDWDQSLGFEMTLNFGAAGESCILQSSTSSPKNR